MGTTQPETNGGPGPLGYMPQLDGLRAIAVLLVMEGHYLHNEPRLFRLSWGTIGVGLFFVLSGFLITNILLEVRDARKGRGVRPLRAFWCRRLLRIVPVFYLTVLVGTVLGVPGIAEYWPWHVLYGTNLLAASGTYPTLASHFWTLAVEEQFYLLWPLVVLYVPALLLPSVMLGGVGTAVLFRAQGCTPAAPLGPFVNCAPLLPSHLDFLFLGGILAWLRLRTGGAGARRFGLAAGCIGAFGVVMFYYVPGYWTLQRFSLALLFTGIIQGASQGVPGPIGRFLSCGPVTYIGKVSYGMYVLHLPAALLGSEVTGFLGSSRSHGLSQAVASTAVTFALASASWHWLEQPIRGLRRHFPYADPGSEVARE